MSTQSDRVGEHGSVDNVDGVVWNDALLWLPTLADECAKAIIFDPPYAVGTPVRGRHGCSHGYRAAIREQVQMARATDV